MKGLNIGGIQVSVPIIQGGMGVGVSLSGLAGAVAANGGVGVISAAQIGYREPDFARHPLQANLRALKAEIAKAKEMAKKRAEGGIIGVNIMVAMRYYEEYVKAAIEAGADLIISGAGLPIELPRLTKGSSIKIAPIVSSLKAISILCKMWERREKRLPDLVIIEGPKAGGHLGFTREQLEHVEELDYDRQIQEMISYIKEIGAAKGKEIPVAVAGGIYDAADAAHALKLGADSVQVATRFVTTYECDASMAYKQAYLDAKKEDIVITQSPVGMPGRAVSNVFLQQESHKIKGCYQCLAHCVPNEIPYCITDALVQAVQGNVDQGLIFCGENAWRSEKMEYVADIMKELRTPFL